MRDAILIGGGGHAMSCLDAAEGGDVRFVGYVAPQPDDQLPLPHLGGDDVLARVREQTPVAFVAVGGNRQRADLVHSVLELGFELMALVASTARVSPHATLAPGCAVLHGALVGPRSRIGVGAVINTGASVDHDCTVEDFAHIAPGTHLAGGVRIGTGAFAGVGVSAIPDVQVGAWAVMGAGAVVIDNIAPGATVVGAPARTRRTS